MDRAAAAQDFTDEVDALGEAVAQAVLAELRPIIEQAWAAMFSPPVTVLAAMDEGALARIADYTPSPKVLDQVRTAFLTGKDTAVITTGASISVDVNAERYMTEATNRLRNVGSSAWQEARQVLSDSLTTTMTREQVKGQLEDVLSASEYRADTIARTETHAAANAGVHQTGLALSEAGVVISKQWFTQLDGRTRPGHAAADGQQVPMDGQFSIAGELLDFPGDPSGSPGNTINCRCTMLVVQEPAPAPEPDEPTVVEQPQATVKERKPRAPAKPRDPHAALKKDIAKMRKGEQVAVDTRTPSAFGKKLDERITALGKDIDKGLQARLEADPAARMMSNGYLKAVKAELEDRGVVMGAPEGGYRQGWYDVKKERSIPEKGRGKGYVTFKEQSDEAMNYFPRSWVERSNAKGETLVGPVGGKDTRGWSATDRYGFGTINIPNSRKFDGGLYQHEWSHRMEDTNPGVTDLEWLFRTRRAGGTEPASLRQLTGMSYGPQEKAVDGGFWNAYIGKVYGSGSTRNNTEILSMAMEDAANGGRNLQRDDDFRHWLLGMLAALA